MLCRHEKVLLIAQELPLQEHELINDWEHPPAHGQLSGLCVKRFQRQRASWVQQLRAEPCPAWLAAHRHGG